MLHKAELSKGMYGVLLQRNGISAEFLIATFFKDERKKQKLDS